MFAGAPGQVIEIGVSAGSALYPDGAITPTALLLAADREMYADKRAAAATPGAHEPRRAAAAAAWGAVHGDPQRRRRLGRRRARAELLPCTPGRNTTFRTVPESGRSSSIRASEPSSTRLKPTRGHAALALPVERGVRARDELLGRVISLQLRKPNCDRPVLGSFCQGCADECEPLPRLGHVQTWEDADELVASVANDHVVRAELLPEAVGDVDQQSVTSGVAARVVDDLEVVDVDECQCERPL
jgi:hypothetical protein